MVKNFQEVMVSFQAEIEQIFKEREIIKARSPERYILEKAACEMLIAMRSEERDAIEK